MTNDEARDYLKTCFHAYIWGWQFNQIGLLHDTTVVRFNGNAPTGNIYLQVSIEFLSAPDPEAIKVVLKQAAQRCVILT